MDLFVLGWTEQSVNFRWWGIW